jgi:hypothetical protein
MNGRLRRLTVAGAFSAVALVGPLGLAGCGDGSGGGDANAPLNGVEKKPAAQVMKDASAALKTAGSVHLKGTSSGSAGITTIDLRFQGDDTVGKIESGDKKAEVIRTGGVTYLKGSKAYYEGEKAPSAVAALAAGRWVKVPATSSSGSTFTLASFADSLSEDADEVTTVAQDTLDGSKVVVVSGKDGTKGYVANTGSPVPLRLEKTGKDGARLEFTDYGKKVGISAPGNAIDLPSPSPS